MWRQSVDEGIAYLYSLGGDFRTNLLPKAYPALCRILILHPDIFSSHISLLRIRSDPCPSLIKLTSSSFALRICSTPFFHQQNLGLISCPTTRSLTTAAQPKSSYSPFEEESLPNYNAEQFDPVRIGETLHDRYVVLGKLDYGANSTVWLCRDLQ